jgi:hypothetical protein
MKTSILRLLAPLLLAVGIATPAFSQTTKEPSIKFFNFLCEIDLTQLRAEQLPSGFPLPEGGSVFTLTSTKTCAGSASARNAKIECVDTIPGWRHTVDVTTTDFTCLINGAQCDLPGPFVEPPSFVKATQRSLTISTRGKAKLTCFYKQ